jgi:hypothetical protein
MFKLIILSFILFFDKTISFLNNANLNNKFRKTSILNSILNQNELRSLEMFKYFISLRDYTIITTGNRNRYIEDIMNINNMNVYYVNIDNLIDNVNFKNFLKNKYNYINYSNESDNVWIFYRGDYVASKNDFMNLIQKNKISK